MGISIKRITAGLTSAVVLAAGGVIAAAGTAAASSGSWGYKYPVGTVAHGSQTFNPVAGLWCLAAAGCDYEPGMTIIIQTANGATFSPVGATAPISPVFEAGPAGTCTVINDQLVACSITKSGHVANGSISGDGLIAPGFNTGITLTVPRTTPSGALVVQDHWYDPSGMEGDNPADNEANFYVQGSGKGGWPSVL
ncbi:hypothetical protein ACFTXM_45165 [Streptomyces sp. NPDC056930]|uniref:hypothetical protein n=1 Tax=unclassified Streptomyces TaxID=2593676 RepID=UPI00363EBED8